MIFSSALIENAVSEFARLPGVGKKTALRLVLHLLKQDTAQVEMFAEAIAKMRRQIKFCKTCHNVSDEDTCTICANASRNHKVVCVVESIRDVIAIENTQQFNGVYHVLGGSFPRSTVSARISCKSTRSWSGCSNWAWKR